MSDLTAAEWAQNAKNQLTDLEKRCSDDDLFCVGYLIPQVELVEVEFFEHEGSFEDWQYTFNEFVEKSLKQDSMTERDAGRIRLIIEEMVR